MTKHKTPFLPGIGTLIDLPGVHLRTAITYSDKPARYELELLQPGDTDAQLATPLGFHDLALLTHNLKTTCTLLHALQQLDATINPNYQEAAEITLLATPAMHIRLALLYYGKQLTTAIRVYDGRLTSRKLTDWTVKLHDLKAMAKASETMLQTGKLASYKKVLHAA